MSDVVKAQWFQILFALSAGPLHGSAIVEEVKERTGGRMTLWPGTLYGSLRDLGKAGWIVEVAAPEDAPSDRGKRRFYELTEAGREQLRAEIQAMRGWVEIAEARDLLRRPS